MRCASLTGALLHWLKLQASSLQHCHQCGGEIETLADICQNCGATHRVQLSWWTILVAAVSIVCLLVSLA